MSEISEEDANAKSEVKYSIKLKQSLDSSNNSQNEDDFFFSSNYLLEKSTHSNFISKTTPNQLNKKEIFESMEIDIKKKLFSSEVAPKSDTKRSYEATSTEPTSIKVKNYKSPRKKYSVFKLIEKGKKNKKEIKNIQQQQNDENENSPNKKERTDIYGNVISKKNRKKVKVSFIDKVTTQSLVNVIDIESFKNYNFIYGMPKEEKIDKTTNCKCCFIF